MAVTANALLIVAHPNLVASKASRAVADLAREHPGVTVHDLYERYPNFYVRKRDEQQRLLAHELILFQYPTYWYSIPPLLKLWFDEVLERGFAYGDGGDALVEKGFLTSTGASQEAYGPTGMHGLAYEAFLPPLAMTARLCRMRWHEPQIFYGVTRATADACRRNAALLLERISGILAAVRS
jgi:glutathione-regulated potassium-efflux system ancillary protein KefF